MSTEVSANLDDGMTDTKNWDITMCEWTMAETLLLEIQNIVHQIIECLHIGCFEQSPWTDRWAKIEFETHQQYAFLLSKSQWARCHRNWKQHVAYIPLQSWLVRLVTIGTQVSAGLHNASQRNGNWFTIIIHPHAAFEAFHICCCPVFTNLGEFVMCGACHLSGDGVKMWTSLLMPTPR